MNRSWLALAAAIGLAWAGAARPAGFPPTYATEASRFFTQGAINGCAALSAGDKAAYNAVINGLKGNGNWTKRGFLYLFSAPSTCWAGIDLKNPGSNAIVVTGACTFSTVTGYQGDAATCQLTNGLNENAIGQYSQNDSHIDAWGYNATAALASRLFGMNSATGTAQHIILSHIMGTGNCVFRLTSSVSITNNVGITACTQAGILMAADRTSSANVNTYANGALIQANASTSTATGAVGVEFLANGTTLFSAASIAEASAGSHEDDAGNAADYAVFHKYMQYRGNP